MLNKGSGTTIVIGNSTIFPNALTFNSVLRYIDISISEAPISCIALHPRVKTVRCFKRADLPLPGALRDSACTCCTADHAVVSTDRYDVPPKSGTQIK